MAEINFEEAYYDLKGKYDIALKIIDNQKKIIRRLSMLLKKRFPGKICRSKLKIGQSKLQMILCSILIRRLIKLRPTRLRFFAYKTTLIIENGKEKLKNAGSICYYKR